MAIPVDLKPDLPLTALSTPAAAAIAFPAAISVPATPQVRSLTARWLDLKTFSHSERYRNAYEVGGAHDFENAQARSLIEGKIKLDAGGRYEVGFRASSGRYFNWAFSDYIGQTFSPRVTSSAARAAFFTPAENVEVARSLYADPQGFAAGLDIHSGGWQFYLRELYFTANPVKAITLEFGSFGIERGLSSEITTFDEDGYLSGERIRLHDPKHLFFDEVSFTNAYFGDIGTVNLFERGSSLKNFNYRQIAAQKRLNKPVSVSGEYTWQTGISTLREAVLLDTRMSRAVDSLRLEGYERVNSITFAGAAQSPVGAIPSLKVDGASGFAVMAEKKLGRLSGDAGYASVDEDYTVYANSRFFHSGGFVLNGDTYTEGNRVFLHASVKLTPAVAAFGFYTHEVGSERILTLNQQGLNAGVSFDLKAMINTERRVF